MITLSRFWARVDKTSTCWLWTGVIREDGYACYSFRNGGDRFTWYVHRLAYVCLVGPIPVGLELDHLCGVRHCVNPDHLEPVTPKVNFARSSAIALQLSKTHCPYGHPYDDENTRWTKLGHRACRRCHRERMRLNLYPHRRVVEVVV